MSEDTKLNTRQIKVGLSSDIINKVEELENLLNTNNKADILAHAIAVYYEIEKAIKESKADVYLEYPGKIYRDKLIIPRFN